MKRRRSLMALFVRPPVVAFDSVLRDYCYGVHGLFFRRRVFPYVRSSGCFSPNTCLEMLAGCVCIELT